MAIDIKALGAVGDGKTLCTEIFARAVSLAIKTKEIITVPAGVFLTGTIDLQGASLHLNSGAVIKGSSNMEDYPVQAFVHNEMGPMRALISCIGGRDVTIEGSGTIDLNGLAFYHVGDPQIPKSLVPFSDEQKAECTYTYDDRPNQSIFFHNVTNLTVKGITVIDAPCWTFSFNECNNVKVLGLTIDTNLNVPNDDGIHFCSCSGVIVANCNISSGDDCIAISGITNWAKPCENIVITNCVLRSCSKALVLGYIYSHVRNVLIDNVIIQGSNRGLCIMSNTEVGLVENVRVNNLIIDTRIRAGNWWGNGEAIFMMAVKHDHRIPSEQKPSRRTGVNIRDIHISGVTCTSENAIGILGDNNSIENVTLNDVLITKKESQNLPLKGNTFDIAPSPETVTVPEDCGLYIENAKDIKLTNVKINSFNGKEQKIIAKNVIGFER